MKAKKVFKFYENWDDLPLNKNGDVIFSRLPNPLQESYIWAINNQLKAIAKAETGLALLAQSYDDLDKETLRALEKEMKIFNSERLINPIFYFGDEPTFSYKVGDIVMVGRFDEPCQIVKKVWLPKNPKNEHGFIGYEVRLGHLTPDGYDFNTQPLYTEITITITETEIISSYQRYSSNTKVEFIYQPLNGVFELVRLHGGLTEKQLSDLTKHENDYIIREVFTLGDLGVTPDLFGNEKLPELEKLIQEKRKAWTIDKMIELQSMAVWLPNTLIGSFSKLNNGKWFNT